MNLLGPSISKFFFIIYNIFIHKLLLAPAVVWSSDALMFVLQDRRLSALSTPCDTSVLLQEVLRRSGWELLTLLEATSAAL